MGNKNSLSNSSYYMVIQQLISWKHLISFLIIIIISLNISAQTFPKEAFEGTTPSDSVRDIFGDGGINGMSFEFIEVLEKEGKKERFFSLIGDVTIMCLSNSKYFIQITTYKSSGIKFESRTNTAINEADDYSWHNYSWIDENNEENYLIIKIKEHGAFGAVWVTHKKKYYLYSK